MKFFFKNLWLVTILGLLLSPSNIKTLKVSSVYSQAIIQLNPKLSSSQASELGYKLQELHYKYELKPSLILALLVTESSLQPLSLSSTGDYSIAQINFKTWSQEFIRLGYEPLDKDLLTSGNISYALDKMALILSILKDRHQSDPHWYANYHSETPKYKNKYLKKVKKHYKKIEQLISISKN